MNKKDSQIIHYQQIYQQYAPMLLGFANKFVSPLFAEDIVHDVFLKIWEKQVFLLPEDEVKRILFTAVRNACIDHLRRLNLEKEIIDKKSIQLKIDELNFFEASEDFFMRKNLLEIVMKKIEELPEKKQEIFRLSYIEGMKANEIAEQLGLSVRTVENQLYRTLLFLRKSLSSKFIFLFILF
jgi:RNA polymerase sigma-70 factor (ECF subfamily)